MRKRRDESSGSTPIFDPLSDIPDSSLPRWKTKANRPFLKAVTQLKRLFLLILFSALERIDFSTPVFRLRQGFVKRRCKLPFRTLGGLDAPYSISRVFFSGIIP